MAILKIEPQVVDSSANFIFGNVYSTGYFFANGAPFESGGGGDVSFVVDEFQGDGTTATFTLSAEPITKNQVTVNYNGATVLRSDFDVANANLTFNSAPANGANIEITTLSMSGVSTSVVTADTATYANSAGYAAIANSVASANITGTITAETVSASSQPNITSTGTLTSLTVSGNAVFNNWSTFQQSSEVLNVKTGATGTVTHDMSTGATFYHTTPAANFTANFTNVSTTDNRAIVAALIIVQGATPYVPTAVQIDGSAKTIKWLGSTAPAGTANVTDVISFSFIRVSSAWNVFGQYATYG